jgi:hypothetical protein
MTAAELEQVAAPVALYPDSLLSQVLMASTYPLECVQAARWVEANKSLKEDAMAAQLEKQPWDPSVKSLVNFPQVLDMMDDKLDWTVKLGDAFIGQQKELMDTIQTLRGKAKDQGNLQSNEQQKVTVTPATVTEPQVIVIEPSDPQVVYVPTYNPTVVYGAWPYPAYPPYYYYPPGYVAGAAMISFGIGFAMGAAWGYAWGGCNWHGGNVNVNVNRNVNIKNTNIDRSKYAKQYDRSGTNGSRGGNGQWKHDSSHRDGVAYRDNKTSKDYGRGSEDRAQRARDSYRGQNEVGTSDRGGNRTNQRDSANQRDRANQRDTGSSRDRGGSGGTRSGGFDDAGRGGATRDYSNRGQQSRGGGGGGANRSGGGGGGGGGRGGGGGGGGRGGGRR